MRYYNINCRAQVKSILCKSLLRKIDKNKYRWNNTHPPFSTAF